MTPRTIHPVAEQELAEAVAYYEGQSAGLGQRFLDEFEAAAGRIQTYPHMYAADAAGYRLAPVGRFQYILVYVDLTSSIWIASVSHAAAGRGTGRPAGRTTPDPGASMPAELIDRFLAAAADLRAAVAGMTRAELLARPVPGKWSTLEVVAHLADFEPVYADRIRRTAALDNPTLLGADETLFAANLAYHDRDVGEELAVIEALRRSTARLLRALPESAFGRPAVHSERGPLTLEALVGSAAGHVGHHLPFIAAKRAALAGG